MKLRKIKEPRIIKNTPSIDEKINSFRDMTDREEKKTMSQLFDLNLKLP